MSDLQKAICLLVSTFHKYSDKEGDPNTLTRGEVKELLKNELGEELVKANDKASVDKFFNELDLNKDNTVDFQEYAALVISITMVTNELVICSK